MLNTYLIIKKVIKHPNRSAMDNVALTLKGLCPLVIAHKAGK